MLVEAKAGFYLKTAPNIKGDVYVYLYNDAELNLEEGESLLETEPPEGFFVSKQTKEYRKSICNSCSKKKLNLCTLCGCFLPAKQTVSTFSCPDNKW